MKLEALSPTIESVNSVFVHLFFTFSSHLIYFGTLLNLKRLKVHPLGGHFALRRHISTTSKD